MKRVLLWAVVVLMLLTLCPLPAVADSGKLMGGSVASASAVSPVLGIGKMLPVARESIAVPSWSLTTLSGQTITQDTYANKTQLLIFYRGAMTEENEAVCGNSAHMISQIGEAYWRDTAGLKIILAEADGGTAENTSAFINTYGSADWSNVVYAYDGNSVMWRLWNVANDSYWVTFCVCAVIQNGELKAVWGGNYSASQVSKELSKYISIGQDPNIGVAEVSGQFRQTEARRMLGMINEFRTGDNAWYWNEDDETKTIYAPNTLGTLQYDSVLEKIAMQRATELAINYAHTRPNGQSCFSVEEDGVTSCGENIAYGYNAFFTSDEVFVAWREDEDPYAGQGHRRNMLEPEFTAVGFGCFYCNGRYYWTQEFGFSHSGAEATAPNDTTTSVIVEFRRDWFPNQPSISQPPTPILTGWQKQNGNWYYYDANGNKSTAWQLIGGKWFYFNSSGVMQTGWRKLSGKWYYFNSSGAMVTGWQHIGGQWYYFNSSGAMVTGWHTIGGKWYYFNSSGAMVTGWQHIGGQWYYFNSSGAMLTGWQTIGGQKYWFNASGAMQKGWQNISSKWYYFNSSGAMMTGWQTIGGQKYYLSADGSMVTGLQKVDGKWHYFESSGALSTASGWRKIGTKWYYFDSNGAAQTGWQHIGGKWYYFESTGVMATGWKHLSGKWYYLSTDGAMVTGWRLIDNVWYYFETSGVMLANTTKTINGKAYTFNASGACTNP